MLVSLRRNGETYTCRKTGAQRELVRIDAGGIQGVWRRNGEEAVHNKRGELAEEVTKARSQSPRSSEEAP